MNLPYITLGTRRLGSRLLNKTSVALASPRYLNCRSVTGAVRMASTLPKLPVFEAISRHNPESTVVVHSNSGRTFKYGELLGDVCKTRNRLYETAGKEDLDGERIAFLVENSYDYVVTLLACLAAKSIAVPLSPAFPAPELQYILNHSEALLLLSSAKFTNKAQEVLKTELDSKPTLLELTKFQGGSQHEQVTLDSKSGPGEAGMMLYTSGTTNRPKGVLIPQSVMTAQARSLIHAWEYTPADHLLHVLPLHHIHGTINAIFTPLFAGSSIEFMFPFNPDAVWKRFAAPFLPDTSDKKKITFFTVVPTVYSRLLTTHKNLPGDLQTATRKAIAPSNLRLAISGSAALPTPIKKAWHELSSGNVLLERYGMTEVGMALSCGLETADRVDGSVGWPLPGVEARLVDIENNTIIEPGQERDPETGRERAGEIQLRGPSIFREYWRNPEATAKEFVTDEKDVAGSKGRWFKTGDVAVRRPAPEGAGKSDLKSQKDWARGDMYFILGRKSADIIKSGGEKVSALEVEREMLSLPQVAECAVLAVPSGKWGQKVGAVVILDKEHVPEGRWTPLEMRRALKDRLAAYKIPQVLKIVDKIPRNAMGKINKKNLVKEVFADEFSGDEL
ncbi:acetyl-CoA synthetase-like protein [Neurospora crassa]|uniref:AMP-binding enzyme n=1 Tax=Neurospora crassa (strain ATCC 24698 / 74-OR23-1A / CBS 708.71 / DSM 1257 / FGSC 987) TaxID=367110 RepID=Q7SDM6_NEUCR|nr:AMP-binding enzyme [Neurospora crassa OR74A]EAA34865.2 AMP-binding enzyme [Neurospora crassa OR74A]KHE80246.1 acetyl-CoA synthetase-like protein [Neurospora crassa]|eukprot:XP_964101.2 AMP-binding enzyme [Neurospora crassa OR74A]